MDALHSCIVELFSLDPKTPLSDDMGPSAVTGWDSLGWLSLLNMVEQRWNIEMSLDEAADIQTIGDLRRVIEKKARLAESDSGERSHE